jgi:hypothetical protein
MHIQRCESVQAFIKIKCQSLYALINAIKQHQAKLYLVKEMRLYSAGFCGCNPSTQEADTGGLLSSRPT